MILAEDTTNPTFYAYFRGFMALFLGLGLKVNSANGYIFVNPNITH